MSPIWGRGAVTAGIVSDVAEGEAGGISPVRMPGYGDMENQLLPKSPPSTPVMDPKEQQLQFSLVTTVSQDLPE